VSHLNLTIRFLQNNHFRSVEAHSRMNDSDLPFRLPMVGLPMLKARELANSTAKNLNPFTIPHNSELMLINNERQRIQNQMTKEKMKNLFSIHEKGTSNFNNREGIIREIRSIVPADERPGYHNFEIKKSTKRYDDSGNFAGGKINIFEGDPKDIDEKLKALEHESQLAPHSRSVAPAHDNQSLELAHRSSKSNANLTYLREALKNRESRKDFVLQSRELLFKEISIRNKKDETEKLKEFIDTENEKLVEAKSSFKEDSDKFQKYVKELQQKAEQTKKETESLAEEKQKKVKHINNLREQLADINRDISKVDDELEVALDHKELTWSAANCKTDFLTLQILQNY